MTFLKKFMKSPDATDRFSGLQSWPRLFVHVHSFGLATTSPAFLTAMWMVFVFV